MQNPGDPESFPGPRVLWLDPAHRAPTCSGVCAASGAPAPRDSALGNSRWVQKGHPFRPRSGRWRPLTAPPQPQTRILGASARAVLTTPDSLSFFLLRFPRLSRLSVHICLILSHRDSKTCKGIWRIGTKCAGSAQRGEGPGEGLPPPPGRGGPAGPREPLGTADAGARTGSKPPAAARVFTDVPATSACLKGRRGDPGDGTCPVSPSRAEEAAPCGLVSFQDTSFLFYRGLGFFQRNFSAFRESDRLQLCCKRSWKDDFNHHALVSAAVN